LVQQAVGKPLFYRFPLVWAVDLLSGRCQIADVKRHRRDLLENGHAFWLDETLEENPQMLDFHTFHVRSLDAMTGTLHDPRFYEFVHNDHEEPDVPFAFYQQCEVVRCRAFRPGRPSS
jgi:hypothetical protein